MHIKGYAYKIFVLWVIVIIQVLLVGVYIFISPVLNKQPINTSDKRISFIKSKTEPQVSNNFNTHNSFIKLRHHNRTSEYFFNSTLDIGKGCYIEGTDIKFMIRNNWDHIQEDCVCLSGWHGPDCAQPEVIWRAFLTAKQTFKIKGPRLKPRRLIYMFKTKPTSSIITEIIVHELANVVDLFVMCSNSEFKQKLSSGYLKEYHPKILFINEPCNTSIMHVILKKVVRDLRSDDCFIVTNANEILNKKALMFIKLYDNWPQPLSFRLKWIVFGFYWQHPKLTITTARAIQIGQLNEIYLEEPNFMRNNLDFNDLANMKSNKKGLRIGDLNHYGGWFCDYCLEPKDILIEIEQNFKNESNLILVNAKGKLDINYIEDLISVGLYIDSKTYAKRAYRFRDNYFAPQYVTDTSWKYDWLLTNIYSKSDDEYQ